MPFFGGYVSSLEGVIWIFFCNVHHFEVSSNSSRPSDLQAPATQVSEAAFIAASDEGNALLASQGCWMVLVVELDRYTMED